MGLFSEPMLKLLRKKEKKSCSSNDDVVSIKNNSKLFSCLTKQSTFHYERNSFIDSNKVSCYEYQCRKLNKNEFPFTDLSIVESEIESCSGTD